MSGNLRTPLKKAQNLGSAKTGSHHWLQQRLSALLLIFMLSWFLYEVINFTRSPEQDITSFLSEPYKIILLSLTLSASLYHGVLGMQVIIEDYIKCNIKRNSLIIFCKLFTFVTIFFVNWSLLKLL